MPLAQILQRFVDSTNQCDILIASAHAVDGNGQAVFSAVSQQQITVAAFLNLFIAWETFLESAIAEYMVGTPTINGTQPHRYVQPTDIDHSKRMLIGNNRFFDYANHQHVKTVVMLYFQNGYPFEPQLSGIFSELSDLRTMRNASAHISFTTQTALESLARRIFGQPRVGITLYDLLMAVDPNSLTGQTVFREYRDKLRVAAEIIATG